MGRIVKTLIWNGSPRKNGDTSSLIEKVIAGLSGEYKIVNAYNDKIHPCIDCRYCWENTGCSIKDDMQQVYSYIQECDNILIASPIYFSELTGALLNVGSRLQTFFCAEKFRHEQPIPKPKKGAVLLVGGGSGNVEKPYDTACTLLRLMNAKNILPIVSSHDTDRRPAVEDADAIRGISDIVHFFETA